MFWLVDGNAQIQIRNFKQTNMAKAVKSTITQNTPSGDGGMNYWLVKSEPFKDRFASARSLCGVPSLISYLAKTFFMIFFNFNYLVSKLMLLI